MTGSQSHYEFLIDLVPNRSRSVAPRMTMMRPGYRKARACSSVDRPDPASSDCSVCRDQYLADYCRTGLGGGGVGWGGVTGGDRNID